MLQTSVKGPAISAVGRILSAALGCLLLVAAAHGDQKALKHDLEQGLLGKTVTSKIMFGGRAILPGYQVDHPVNTLVYAESGEINYRVEAAIFRGDIAPQGMLSSFPARSNFKIASVEIKDDKLELKLESVRGDSARLKLMLGAGWQSKLDMAAVQAQLSRIFDFPEPAQPAVPAASVVPGPGGTTIVAANTYHISPNAPRIPGRISDDQLQQVFSMADSESQKTVSDLFEQARPVSAALLTIQRQADHYPNFANHPKIREISNMQGKLGKSLQPRQVEDVAELNNLLSEVMRIFGSFAPQGSFGLYGQIRQAVQVQQAGQARILGAKQSIIEVEQSLDSANLNLAGQLYPRLADSDRGAQVASLQKYLQCTAGLRDDLAAYVQATQLDRRQTLPLVQQVQNLTSEVALLNASQNKPVAVDFLQKSLESDRAAVKQQLDALPVFHTELTPFQVSDPSDLHGMNAAAKVNFLSAKLQTLDQKMATAQVLASLLQRPETMAEIQQIFGASEIASLNAKAADLLKAQQVRANLVQRLGNEQQALRQEQERAAAQRAEQERRIEVRQELARRVVMNATMVAELEDQYARTTIVGYRLKASETRSSLRQEVLQNRPLPPQFWQDVQNEYNRLLPALRESQADEVLAIIRSLKASASN